MSRSGFVRGGSEGLCLSVLSLARLGLYDPHSWGRLHISGLVRCGRFLVRAAVWCIRDTCMYLARSVLSFSRVFINMRHYWVICPCGCLEDTRDSDLARSSSANVHPPVLLFAVYEALAYTRLLNFFRFVYVRTICPSFLLRFCSP